MATYNKETAVLEMTMAEWKAKHKDFKSTGIATTGKRYRSALMFIEGLGTCSVPVRIIKKGVK